MATPSILRYVRHTDTPPVYGRFVDLKGLHTGLEQVAGALNQLSIHVIVLSLIAVRKLLQSVAWRAGSCPDGLPGECSRGSLGKWQCRTAVRRQASQLSPIDNMDKTAQSTVGQGREKKPGY